MQKKTAAQLDREVQEALSKKAYLIRVPGKAALAIEADSSPYPRRRTMDNVNDELRALAQSYYPAKPTREQSKLYDKLDAERRKLQREEDRAIKARRDAAKQSRIAVRSAKSAARKAARPASSNTATGECQICGRRHKLVRGLVALHGYKRPGTGSTHGRCPGAQGLPFEISRDLLNGWIRSLMGQLADDRRALAKMTDSSLAQIVAFPVDQHGRPLPPVTYVRGERDARGYDMFQITLNGRVRKLESSISNLEREIAHQSRRSDAWHPR